MVASLQSDGRIVVRRLGSRQGARRQRGRQSRGRDHHGRTGQPRRKRAHSASSHLGRQGKVKGRASKIPKLLRRISLARENGWGRNSYQVTPTPPLETAVLHALDDAVHDSQADLTDSDALTFYLLFYSIPGPTLIQSGPTFLKYLQTVRRTASTKVAGSQATVRYQS